MVVMAMTDPFYRSAAWRYLREARLRLDHGRCVHCQRPGVVVDHIVPRRAGGADDLANTRSLCRRCDNAIKERNGRRRRAGVLPGADLTGAPLDRNHDWHGGRSISAPLEGYDRPVGFPRSKFSRGKG